MNRLTGMTGFSAIWFGQLISLLGTSMTSFALTIWAWQETGQATALALVGFFSFGPAVLLSPVAGALVDRWNRKLVMMLSDLAAGVASILTLALHLSGSLEIWHLYVLGAWTGAFSAFQWPAYSAAISTTLPKTHYTRASGMMSLAESASSVAAPILAGILLGIIGLGGILVVDIVTFSLAVSALFFVLIPPPKRSGAGAAGRGLWQESLYGFRYIWRRPLLNLQLVFFAVNLVATFVLILLAPMVLASTGNDELVLGSVQSALGAGGVVGGLLLSVWGGPTRRIHGVLVGMILSSLLGSILMGLANTLTLWLIAGFFITFFIPILNGSNQAIWQAKVAPEVQGKVFAARRLIAQITAPLAMLAAGPLADYVFEPALMPGGALVPLFGVVVGTGPGAGMSLMFVLSGMLGVLIGVGGYLSPSVRRAEDLLPDHNEVEEVAGVEADAISPTPA